MGLFTKDIKTMNDLFVHQLQDIYYAEKQLVKALPKMAEKATDKQLKQGFLTHLDETKTHVQRLEEVFRMHGAEVKAVDCPAIDGIIEEADDVAGEIADKAVLDAALINAAQAAEHYEITRYGSLIAWARQLGRNDCAGILQQTLDLVLIDTFEDSPPAFARTPPRFDALAYYCFIGTSQATPHVSGVAAMLVQQGYTDPKAIEAALEKFAIDPSTRNQRNGRRDNDFGFGEINARTTLRGLGLAK